MTMNIYQGENCVIVTNADDGRVVAKLYNEDAYVNAKALVEALADVSNGVGGDDMPKYGGFTVKVIDERGWHAAYLGLSLAYKQPLDKMDTVAHKLNKHSANSGHLKFLESVIVWLDITAPRYWWQQFDTYRVGVSKQSESTMHTIMKHPLTENDFQIIDINTLQRLNDLIKTGEFERLKAELPEGFLQRRIVCTNYKTLRHMYIQRHNHKLKFWRDFFAELEKQLSKPEFVVLHEELKKR